MTTLLLRVALPLASLGFMTVCYTADAWSQQSDVGPAGQFRDVELRAGDWISARGPVARVNDRPVIFACEINVDGDSIRIDRRIPSQHARQSTQTVSGKVAILKELKIRGSDQTHQVVRIVTKEGKQIIADLGEKASLQDVNLSYGQEISIQGRWLG